MSVLPNHTVSIDDNGFYAENPDVSEPFQRNKYDMVEVDSGPPRHYQTGIQLRTINFTTTINNIKPPHIPLLSPEELEKYNKITSTDNSGGGYLYSLEEVLEMLKNCIGIHLFTSRYIGSFPAIIQVKVNSFTPDSVKVAFTVEEISNLEKI
jgi:hypothetical protein